MDIWLIAALIICMVIVFILLGVFFLANVKGLQMVSVGDGGYNIHMNVAINGHNIVMLLDTGSDFSVVSGGYVNSLGLDRLPVASSIQMTSMNGQSQQEQMVKVTMKIENTRPFITYLLINPQQSFGIHGSPDNMLSLADLYKAYRLQFVPLR